MAAQDDDDISERGMFVPAQAPFGAPSSSYAHVGTQGGKAPNTGAAGNHGLVREAPATGLGWGRGPIPVDKRKYRYDRLRGLSAPALSFSASKADRLDTVEAGDKLDLIHRLFGIDREPEARIVAFDKALWLEHTLNGGSLMRPGRGTITADDVAFDIAPIRDILGVDVRRFFRSFADDIAAANLEVLESLDPYNPASVELVAQLKQVALERGLQKYPHLAFDAADACTLISMEERTALMASKDRVLSSSTNAVDGARPRVSSAAATADAT